MSKKTIIVVDDERDIRETVKTVLETHDYEVITAVDADDCLEKLEDQKPDLILLDIMMPGTPVKEAIKEIKDVKISYLTVVKTSTGEKEELLQQDNVVGFIEKPFDMNELVKKVGEMVEK